MLFFLLSIYLIGLLESAIATDGIEAILDSKKEDDIVDLGRLPVRLIYSTHNNTLEILTQIIGREGFLANGQVRVRPVHCHEPSLGGGLAEAELL